MVTGLVLASGSIAAHAAEKCAGDKAKCSKPATPTCGAKHELFEGTCVPRCAAGQQRGPKGECKKLPACGPDQAVVLGKCFDKCPDGKPRNGQGKCGSPQN